MTYHFMYCSVVAHYKSPYFVQYDIKCQSFYASLGIIFSNRLLFVVIITFLNEMIVVSYHFMFLIMPWRNS
jgi:hypothetical protein